jgi:hypothetical protein
MFSYKSVKNESAEYSFYEKTALNDCKRAYDALNSAVLSCITCAKNPQDNRSNIDWASAVRALNRALKDFPVDEFNEASYDDLN